MVMAYTFGMMAFKFWLRAGHSAGNSIFCKGRLQQEELTWAAGHSGMWEPEPCRSGGQNRSSPPGTVFAVPGFASDPGLKGLLKSEWHLMYVIMNLLSQRPACTDRPDGGRPAPTERPGRPSSPVLMHSCSSESAYS